MKNAMKKLMSLVLVAVLLVSAVPFAASAEEATGYAPISVTVIQKVDGVDQTIHNVSGFKPNAERIVVGAICDALRIDRSDFSNAWCVPANSTKGYDKGYNSDIPAGSTLTIRLNDKVTPTETTDPKPTDPKPTEPKPTDPVVNKVTIVVKKDGVEGTAYDVEIQNASTTVQNLITHKINAAEIAGMDFAAAYVSNRGYIDLNDAVNAGEKVYIAFSTPATKVEPINIVVKVESSGNVVWSGEKVPANGKTATVENLLTYAWNSAWEDVYAVDHVWSHEQQKNVARGAAIEAGDTVYFMLKEKSTNNNNNNNNGADDDYVVDEEWMKDIWLYIYTNNDLVQPAKRVLLNDYEIIKDHVINKSNALSVVDDYFKATNSNNGIIWKGMYRETNDITAMQFVQQLGRDDYIDNLDVLRSKGTVVIKVRVTGVTAKTAYTADSSNPKTGDEIYMAVTVLGLSAASLAAVAYVYSKKRLAK